MALELAESWPWKRFLNTLRCHPTWLAGKSPNQMGWWHRRVHGHHPVDRNPGALANVTTRQRCSSLGVWFHEWALAHPGMGMVIISTFSWKGFSFRLMGCPMKKDDTKLTIKWENCSPIYWLVVRDGPATCWFANQPCRGRRFRSRQQSHPAFAGPPNKQNQH